MTDDPYAALVAPPASQEPVAPANANDPYAQFSPPTSTVSPLPDTTNIEKTAQNNVAVQEPSATPQTPVQNLTNALGYNPVAPYKQGDVLPQPVRQHMNDSYADKTATTASDWAQSVIPQVAASLGTAAGIASKALYNGDDAGPAIRGFVSKIVPAGASAAVMEQGALAGGAMAAKVSKRPLVIAVGSVAGALVAAYGAGAATEAGQKKILDENPKIAEWLGQNSEQIVKDQQHYSYVAGQLATNLAFFNPSNSWKQAIIGGAVGGGLEAGREATSPEKMSPANIALSTIMGAAMGEPNKAGGYLQSKLAAGMEYLRPAVAQQMNVSPSQVTDDHINDALVAAHPEESHPHGIDYDHAATVMFGEDGADKGAKLLRDINSATGVRPEQVFDDAKNNPDVADDLRNGVIPKAYDHLIQQQPVPKAPEGVQYTTLDPSSKEFAITKMIAAGKGIELQPAPKAGEAPRESVPATVEQPKVVEPVAETKPTTLPKSPEQIAAEKAHTDQYHVVRNLKKSIEDKKAEVSAASSKAGKKQAKWELSVLRSQYRGEIELKKKLASAAGIKLGNSANLITGEQSAVGFIKRMGGIKPSAETDRYEGNKFSGVFNKNGLSPEDMRASLQEEGYIPPEDPNTPPKSTVDDLHDILDAHDNGIATYRHGMTGGHESEYDPDKEAHDEEKGVYSVNHSAIDTGGHDIPLSQIPEHLGNLSHTEDGGFKDFIQKGKYPNTIVGVRKAIKDFLVSKTKADGFEHMVFMGDNGAVTHYAQGFRDSGGDKVPYTEEMMSALQNPDNNIEIHHSHPEESSLSPGDLGGLQFPGSKSMTAHTPKGRDSGASLSDDMLSAIKETPSKIKHIFQSAVFSANTVTHEINKLISAGLVKAGVAGSDISLANTEMRNIVLKKSGIINYTSSNEIHGISKELSDQVIDITVNLLNKELGRLGYDRLKEGGEVSQGNPAGGLHTGSGTDSGEGTGHLGSAGEQLDLFGARSETAGLGTPEEIIETLKEPDYKKYAEAREELEEAVQGKKTPNSIEDLAKTVAAGHDEYGAVYDRMTKPSMTEAEEVARNRRVFNMSPHKDEPPDPKTPDQLVNPDFAKEDKAPPTLFGKVSKAISDLISVNPDVRAETKNLEDLGKVAEEDPVMAGKIAARYIHETLSPDTVSDTAGDAATILKERLGQAARETTIAQNALNKVWRSAGKLVGAQKDSFIDYMQNRSNGATIDPALQETADVVRKINQDIAEKLQALPGNEQRAFIKDYFTQNWKDTAIARRVMNEAIARQGSGRNLQQRIIPSHAEGIALGLEDKFDHPLETVMNYVKNVQKYIAHVEAVNDMIEGGMAKRFKGDEDTTGYTKLDGTVGSDNGEGAVYAQDDAARIYNNAISKGFEGGAGEIFKAINFSSNVLRRMKLGLLNFFHAGVITQASMSSEFGLGTKEITGAFDKDNPQGAGLSIIKGAARMALSTLAPFKHLAEGGKGLQEYKAPGSTDPRTQQIIDILSRANAITSSMPEYMKSGAQVDLWDGWKRGDFDNFADKASDFVNGLTLKNAAVKIPKLMFQTVARAMDTTVKPLFDWYTPRMKTGAAMEAMGQFMDTHPNATHDEQLQAASAIGDSIDNRMGEMITQNLFLNRKLEQSINQGFLSYGWVIGQLRGGIGGAKDIAMFKNTPNAQYIIGTIATTALLNTLYQYLHTGKPPQDLKDLMAPKTGGIQNAGGEVVPEREFGPSHESQWYHYANDFTGELFGNEANPLIPFVKMLATGKNWADQDITDRNDPKAMDYIKAMGDQFEPIMLSTLSKGAKKGSHLTTLERATGFRQVPAFVANPEGVKEQTEERNERNWEKSQKFDEKQKNSYEQ